MVILAMIYVEQRILCQSSRVGGFESFHFRAMADFVNDERTPVISWVLIGMLELIGIVGILLLFYLVGPPLLCLCSVSPFSLLTVTISLGCHSALCPFSSSALAHFPSCFLLSQLSVLFPYPPVMFFYATSPKTCKINHLISALCNATNLSLNALLSLGQWSLW